MTAREWARRIRPILRDRTDETRYAKSLSVAAWHELADILDAYADLIESRSRGASEGGKAVARMMTPEQRSEAARKAVRARWAKD